MGNGQWAMGNEDSVGADLCLPAPLTGPVSQHRARSSPAHIRAAGGSRPL